MKFHIPSNIVEDFEDYLLSGICKSVNQIRDWHGTPQVYNNIRVELTEGNSKSKFSNSDNIMNCRASKYVDIRKGDYLVDTLKNVYYLCMWRVNENINCKSTQVQMCNISVQIERFKPETVDNNGMVTSAAQNVVIVPTMKGLITRGGYYDYESGFGEAGISPNNKQVVTLQMNFKTLAVKINDELDVWGSRYKVVDIDMSEVNSDGQTGMIMFYIEKKVGN